MFPAPTQRSVCSRPPWTDRQRALAWAALAIASLVVLLPNLSYPLIEPDETRYAQIALEMNASRDWITPTLDGVPYLDKPPLMYWLTAASFSLLGNHETSARLPSMLAAWFTILLTYALGSRIVGRRGAWIGSMSLAMSGGFVLAGRFLILDAMLALFTTTCLLSGYIAVRGQRHRWAWWALAGVACALGTLTKGPLALVLCAPPLVASGWLRADQTRIRILHWVSFVIPMMVFCVPWYIAIAKFNSSFAEYFFWEHNLKRFTQGSNHEQPFWFYLPVLYAAMFPASLLLPSVGVFMVRRSDTKRKLRSKDLGFLFCAAAWILLFFSLASCKLPTYILPAIPLLCLMTGVMLDQTVFRSDANDRIKAFLRPFPQRATMILLVGFVVIAATDVWIGGHVSAAVVIAVVLSVIMGGVVFRWWDDDLATGTPGWAAVCVVAIALLSFASTRLMPTISTQRSLFIKTARLAEQHRGALIVFYGENRHGLEFHLSIARSTYFPGEWRDEFAAFLMRQGDVILVTSDERIDDTRTAIAGSHQLIASSDHEHLYFAQRLERPADQVTRLNSSEVR